MLLNVVEFFNYNDELWYRTGDGSTGKVEETSTEIIDFMIELIEKFYPKAYAALAREYERCSSEMAVFRYRVVLRFCRCNFGNIDNVHDVDAFGRLHLECVPCPLRGECRYEGVICRPEFDHNLRPAELRVMELWYKGLTKEEISEHLYLSVHTVNQHVRNALARLGMHEKAEFFRYAERNNLFKI